MRHELTVFAAFILAAAMFSRESRAAAPEVTSSQFAVGTVGTSFSYQIVATNAPASYTATGLPPGLDINQGNGLISGTPTEAGFTAVTVSATNPDGTGTKTVAIGINEAPGPGTPQITSSLTATGDVGTAFNYTITASGDGTISYFAANLPPGLVFNSPTISGTPTIPGTFDVVIAATNGSSNDVKTLVVTINGTPLPPGFPQITSPLIYPGLIGEPFVYQITATGDPTITFGASGLPPGLIIFGANIFGSPTTVGVFDVTLTVSNSVGTDRRTLTLLFGSQDLATLSITSPVAQTVNVSEPYQYTITASGLEPITFSASGLPPGLSFNAGVISGTPTQVGTYNITLNASNLFLSDSKVLVLTVQLLDSDGDGVPDSVDKDDDNDGFTDQMEIVLGSSATSAGSTPFDLGAVTARKELDLSKGGVKLNFAKLQSDSISFSGVLPVPAGFVFTAKHVTMDVGGVIRDVTLDPKGKSPRGNNSFKIGTKPKNGVSKFSVKLNKGDFDADLADDGLSNADAKDKSVTIPIVLIFNGEAFETQPTLLYSAKAGKSGKTKQPR